MSRIVLTGLIALALVCVSCSRREEGLAPGNVAPDFSLKTLDGQELTLKSFAGKRVLLNFWATWCGPCVDELPALQALYTKLQNQGFTVLGVGVDDSPERLKEFQQRFKITYPIVVDPTGGIKGRYGIVGLPESFLLDSEGRIVMVLDPSSNQPITKFIGPRDWNSPLFEKLFSATPVK